MTKEIGKIHGKKKFRALSPAQIPGTDIHVQRRPCAANHVTEGTGMRDFFICIVAWVLHKRVQSGPTLYVSSSSKYPLIWYSEHAMSTQFLACGCVYFFTPNTPNSKQCTRSAPGGCVFSLAGG